MVTTPAVLPGHKTGTDPQPGYWTPACSACSTAVRSVWRIFASARLGQGRYRLVMIGRAVRSITTPVPNGKVRKTSGGRIGTRRIERGWSAPRRHRW